MTEQENDTLRKEIDHANISVDELAELRRVVKMAEATDRYDLRCEV